MLIRTDELTGLALNWAVAVAEGYQPVYTTGAPLPMFRKGGVVLDALPSYSTDWAEGGPIIEREKIWIGPVAYIDPSVTPVNGKEWMAKSLRLCPQPPTYGNTALIAAMRCYVASKLGDEVDVPDSLGSQP